MWAGVMMALLLAGGPGVEPIAATSEPAGVKATPVSTANPASVDVLFSSKFTASRFHATGAWLSSDGKRVAFFRAESPAIEARASTLVIKDVKTDAKIWQKDILTVDESRRLEQPALDRLVRSRLIEAGAKLSSQNWTPLEGGPLPEPDFASDACFLEKSPPPRTTVFSGLKVTYQEPRLRVERDGKRLVDVRRPSWRAFNKSCKTFNPSWLQSLYVDTSQRLMLVGLGHCGVDACPEPAQQFHVVPLPGGANSRQSGTRSHVEGEQVRLGFESTEDPLRTLYAQGVPAVSEDGTRVLVGWVDEDGARQDANLQLEARQVDDNTPAWTAVLLRAGEISASKGTLEKVQGLERQVEDRVVAANAELARGNWKTLKAFNPTPLIGTECATPSRQTVSLPGLNLGLEAGLLTLRSTKEGKPVERAVPLSPPAGKPGPCGDGTGVFLETVYADPERKVLLLQLGSCESPECPVPAPRFHALRLP